MFERTYARLWSRLSPQECAARLNAQMESPYAWFPSRSVIGRVDERGGYLRRRKAYHGDAFGTVASVKFSRDASGTDIEIASGVSETGQAFLMVWLALTALLILGGGFIAAATWLAGWAGVGVLAFIAVPTLMFAAVAVSYIVSRRLSRGDDAYLADFVADILNASADITDTRRS